MTVHRVHAHGVIIDTEISMDATPASWDGPAGLHLQWGDKRTIPEELPPGLVLADHADGRRRWYGLVQRGESAVLRAPEVCDVTIDAIHRRLVTHRDPRTSPDVAGLVASGAALAAALALEGACVFHASAVELGGRAVVIAGPSGAGKSTVAAALCRDGAQLFSDDLLRIDLDAGPFAHRGTNRLRLRPGAALLAEGLPDDQRALTADGRMSAAFASSPRHRLPIGAVLVPRHGSQPRIRPLRGGDALTALMPAGRIQSWREASLQRRWLSEIRSLAAAVPLFELELPAPAQLEAGAVSSLLDTLAAA